MGEDEEQLLAELGKHERWISRQAGVTGTGIGFGHDGHPCIKVYTDRMPADVMQKISSVMQGLRFEFEETGEFRAL
jgi:hypothetical protein